MNSSEFFIVFIRFGLIILGPSCQILHYSGSFLCISMLFPVDCDYTFCVMVWLIHCPCVECRQQPFTSHRADILMYATHLMYNSFWTFIALSWGLVIVVFQPRFVFECHLLGLVIPCGSSSPEIGRLHGQSFVPTYSTCVLRMLVIAKPWVDDGLILAIDHFASETCILLFFLCVLFGLLHYDLLIAFFQDRDYLWIGIIDIVLRICAVHWSSVLIILHCIDSISMLLLQSCNVAGFWIYYLMNSETFRGSWFYPHASVDIVGRLFVMILGFCFHLFSYYSDSRLVCDLYLWHILFFCSLAREKLAVGYFSKATLLPAIIGLDRFAACAWTA